MNILVVVPAYNEATTIGAVVRAVPSGLPVLVVDDGSDDSTAREAATAGARVVRHVLNRGLGGALRTGFLYALRNEYDGVVTLDADGQHDPQHIEKFLSALEHGAHVVIGERSVADMPTIRQWYNRCGGALVRVLLGVQRVDTESGFRALSACALEQFQLTASHMDISSEIIAEAHRAGMCIESVPITVRYTAYSLGKGQSFIEGVRTAWRLFLKSISRAVL